VKLKIAVLFLERDRKRDVSFYQVGRFAEIWRADGHDVEFLYGTKKFVPADLLFMHVDLSVVPKKYLEFAERYPVAINKSVVDIRKTAFSKNLITKYDDYQGPVIVKTNLNHYGQPEARDLFLRLPNWATYPKQLIKRYKLRRTRYQIYPTLSDVPERIHKDKRFIIEKFLPEMEGEKYCLRYYFFMGDVYYSERLICNDRIIKSSSKIEMEQVELDSRIVELRHQLGFDYGKFDYVIHDGEIHLLDPNKTPCIRTKNATPEYNKSLDARARAVYDYL